MSILIRLLKTASLILAVYPGILIVIAERLPGLKRMKSNGKYAFSILAVSLMELLIFKKYLIGLFFAAALFLPYFLEFIAHDSGNRKRAGLLAEISGLRLPVFVMIVCPVCEETIYRWGLWKFLDPAEYFWFPLWPSCSAIS